MKTFKNGVLSESSGDPLAHDEWLRAQLEETADKKTLKEADRAAKASEKAAADAHKASDKAAASDK